MKAKSASASSARTRSKRVVKKTARKAKIQKTAGTRPLTRKSELIDSATGYTGDRGDARSATSGIP